MTRIFLALPALLFLGACQEENGTAPEYRPEEAGTVDHALCLLGFAAVPVQKVDPGHHLIDARINGQSGKFVLDTGANLTVVDASRAERFGLSADGGALAGLSGVLSAGAAGSATPTRIDSLKLGPITIRQSRVVVADLGQLLTALSRVSGEEVSGIIGQDVLNEHRAIIDVSRPMLYLLEEDEDLAPVSAERCQQADESRE